MSSKTYGYARVCSKEQNLDRQLDALIKFGVPERDIITDKASGKDFDRPGYIALKTRILREGDTLVIEDLDRLGRNKQQIKEELEYYSQVGIHVKILNLPTILDDDLLAQIETENIAYDSESPSFDNVEDLVEELLSE